MKRVVILLVLLGLVILGVIFRPYIRAAFSPILQRFERPKTIAERVQQYGARARARLSPHFQQAQPIASCVHIPSWLPAAGRGRSSAKATGRCPKASTLSSC